MKIRLLLTILLLTATIAANTQIMERTFLKKVLTKLEKIESATYYVTDESRQPDDSTTLFSSKEFELIAIESWSRQVSFGSSSIQSLHPLNIINEKADKSNTYIFFILFQLLES